MTLSTEIVADAIELVDMVVVPVILTRPVALMYTLVALLVLKVRAWASVVPMN